MAPGLSQFLSIGWRVHCIYLAVYGPETKGGFGLEEKTKAVCSLGRKTGYGGLRNVRPPVIDLLGTERQQGCSRDG